MRLALSNEAQVALITLLGALGGVLLTGLFALISTLLANKAQHEKLEAEQQERRYQAFREEKKTAYLEVGAAATNLRDVLLTTRFPEYDREVVTGAANSAELFALLPEEVQTATRRALAASISLDLFAPEGVSAAYNGFIEKEAYGFVVMSILRVDTGGNASSSGAAGALEDALIATLHAMHDDLSSG